MIIERFDIESFGIHKDLHIDNLSQNFNLFFGRNECGKSTLLNFIRAIFFGMKKKCGSYPYYINTNNKHGGSIDVRYELDKNLYRICRYFDNRKGSCVEFINLEKQQELSEYVFEQVFSQKKQVLFENIFGFGLNELCELSSLNVEEIKNYIYGASLGIDVKFLQGYCKKLLSMNEEIFKKGGQKQRLKIYSKQIDALKRDLSYARENMTNYENLRENLVKLEVKQKELSREKNELELSYRGLKSIKDCWSDVEKLESIEKSIEKLGVERVFDNILEIKDKLNENNVQIANLKLQCDTINSQVDNLTQQSNNLIFNENLIASKHEFDNLLTQKGQLKNLKAQIIKLENEKIGFTKEFYILKEYLREFSNEDRLKEFDISADTKNKIVNFEIEFDRIERQIENQEQKCLDQKEKVGKYEEEKRKIENIKLIEIFATKELFEKALSIEYEIKRAKNLLMQMTYVEKESDLRFLLKNRAMIVLFLSFLFLSICLFMNKMINTLGLVILDIFFVIFLIIVKMKMGNNTIKIELERKIEYIRNFCKDNKLDIEGFDDFALLESLQKRIDEYRLNLENLERVKREISWIETRDGSEEMDKLLKSKGELRDRFEDFLKSTNVPIDYNIKTYKSFFENILDAKRLLNSINMLDVQISLIKEEESRIHSNLADFVKNCKLEEIIDKEKDFDINLDKINTEMKKDIEIYQKRKELESTIDNLKSHNELNRTSLEQKLKMQEELLKDVHCSSIDEFKERERKFIEIKEKMEKKQYLVEGLQKRSSDLMISLEEFIKRVKGIKDIDNLLRQMREIQERIEELDLMITDSQVQKGRLENELKTIVQQEEKMYDNLNEKTFYENNMLKEGKSWLNNRVFLELIDITKRKYETEKQPEVIRYASEIFREFTIGEYIKIVREIESGNLKVLDKRSMSKGIESLSLGTQQQLYLSLRLGYINEYCKNNEGFPIIFDDILVNFDNIRSKSALEVLAKLSKDHQVFFFTCHEEIEKYLEESCIDFNKVIL